MQSPSSILFYAQISSPVSSFWQVSCPFMLGDGSISVDSGQWQAGGRKQEALGWFLCLAHRVLPTYTEYTYQQLFVFGPSSSKSQLGAINTAILAMSDANYILRDGSSRDKRGSLGSCRSFLGSDLIGSLWWATERRCEIRNGVYFHWLERRHWESAFTTSAMLEVCQGWILHLAHLFSRQPGAPD